MNECRVPRPPAGERPEGHLGRRLSGPDEHGDRELHKDLDSDPKLLELAAPFAECLKSKGERVTSAKPLALSVRGMDVWGEQADRLGKAGTVTAEAARPYLAKEITSALADLECGRTSTPPSSPCKSGSPTRPG